MVVIGATGTGKSAAAVSLAQKLSGEVINADAMQMYKGKSRRLHFILFCYFEFGDSFFTHI